MPEPLLNSPLLYSVALTLIHFLWQGVLIALALKISLIITPLKNSRIRYGLSSFAMTSNLLLPIITFLVISQPTYQQLSATIQNPLLLTDNLAYNGSSNLWNNHGVEFLPYLSISWLIITTILASKLLIELYSVNRLAKSHVIAPEKLMIERFERLINKLQLTQTPKLLISLKTNVPMAFGWLKPVVLIPAGMITGLSPMQLDMLILHELAHIRRHDYLVNFMQTLVETLLFFHPAVHWVSKQMRNEREYCSDDIAVKHSGDAIAYAHTLADTASLCRKHRHHTIPSIAMAASGGDLTQRVLRIVDHHHCSTSSHSGKWLASAIIILSIITVTSKQLINFPIIDITTGSISLYKKSNDSFIPAFDTLNAQKLSTTTIAEQLISKDSFEVKETTPTDFTSTNKAIEELNKDIFTDLNIIADNNIVNNEIEPDASTSSALTNALSSTKSIIDKPLNSLYIHKKSNNEINSITPSAQTNVEIVLADRITKQQPIVESIESTITEKKSIKETISSEQESIASLAFIETDSTKNQSEFTNPYADEISSLTEDPLTLNSNKFAAAKLSIKKSSDKIAPLSLQEEVPNSNDAATLITSIEPRYPSSAKRKGVELDVMVTFIIDKEGLVQDIEFESKNKVNYFRTTIRSAMEKWRFLPANVNGEPVESTMSKIFSFNLMS